ncbi:unnamed protein product [Peniophora sp. CBMAI 1063]|nr:unnamed protein product [Peniophora sp. CBMAI 1063]
MPPRRSKSTPKAAAPVAPPAPTKRSSRASTKVATESKKVSPKVIKAEEPDVDAVFRTKNGGKGSLKYDGSTKSRVRPSDLNKPEVSPTPAGPVKAGPSKKKVVPVEAKKVAGRRRVSPRPIRRKVQVLIPRTSRRRGPVPKDSDSDIEVVEYGTLHNDEGYASADPVDEDSEDAVMEDVVDDEDGAEEAETGDEGEGEGDRDDQRDGRGEDDVEDKEEEEEEEEEEEAEEEDGMEVDESSDDEDDNGNLKGFIDDAGEESEDSGDGMDVDEDEGEQPDSSPLPTKISKPGKKRAAANLSDVEDVAPTKRRVIVHKDGSKTIKAIGYTARVDLKVRGAARKAAALEQLAEQRRVPRKARASGVGPAFIATEKNTAKEKSKAKPKVNVDANTKDKKVLKDSLMFRSKGKKKAEEPKEPEEPVLVDPQFAGCEVTHVDKQSSLMWGLYNGDPVLKAAVIDTTRELQPANLDVIENEDQFIPLDTSRIQCLATSKNLSKEYMVMGAHASPKDLVFKPAGTGWVLCPKGAASGEAVDFVLLAFVLSSNIIEGRTYKTAQGGTRLLKELELLLIQQDCDRALSVISMVWGGKILNLVVTEDGAITFSTKHTAVDEEGNAEKKKTGLGNNFLAKSSRAIPPGTVHADLERRPHEGTDTIPVFNSTENFLKSNENERMLTAKEVLTQTRKPDTRWNREIPQGSLVAVHSTVSLYTSNKGAKAKYISFNLLGAQIIAMPKDA